jgi:F-type H+-transporting ATPase subunit a
MVFASGFSWAHALGLVGEHGAIQGGPLKQCEAVPSGSFVDAYLYADCTQHLEAVQVTMVMAWVAAGLVVLFSVVGRMGLERAKARGGLEQYFADDRLSLRNVAELITGFWHGTMADLLERKDVRLFYPFIGTLFIYIITCNLMGLIPGMLPPTDHISHNTGLALSVFVLFVFVGMKRDAIGFIKHLMGPVAALAILLFPIECISLLARPLSLTLRLTGNMFGDHQVFVMMSDLSHGILVPIPFLLLATIVSAIQAFIFALLTVIYINLSVPHNDEHH